MAADVPAASLGADEDGHIPAAQRADESQEVAADAPAALFDDDDAVIQAALLEDLGMSHGMTSEDLRRRLDEIKEEAGDEFKQMLDRIKSTPDPGAGVEKRLRETAEAAWFKAGGGSVATGDAVVFFCGSSVWC